MSCRYTCIAFAFCFLFSVQSAVAQTNAEKARGLAEKGIELMDAGKFQESIHLLQEAIILDPATFMWPYEIGLAYYMQKDYKAAIVYFENSLKYPDHTDQVYQMLGNCQDLLGQTAAAIRTYEKGLVFFPDAGRLYLELGVVQLMKKDYNKALQYFEQGIAVNPSHASNYYWAAKLYGASTEEVWAMIYGEIFMNLERNTKRTAEISQLLFSIYKSEIEFTSDTSFSVSFSQDATLKKAGTDPADTNSIRLPYGIVVYEPAMMMALLSVSGINLPALDTVRKSFLEFYETNYGKDYPNVLFAYQKKVQAAGHLSAYNYWILSEGDQAAFQSWVDDHDQEWQDFINWFEENGMSLSKTHFFHRTQY